MRDDRMDLSMLQRGTRKPHRAWPKCDVRPPHYREKHVGYDWCFKPAQWEYGDDHRICDEHAEEARKRGYLSGINGNGRWRS